MVECTDRADKELDKNYNELMRASKPVPRELEVVKKRALELEDFLDLVGDAKRKPRDGKPERNQQNTQKARARNRDYRLCSWRLFVPRV